MREVGPDFDAGRRAFDEQRDRGNKQDACARTAQGDGERDDIHPAKGGEQDRLVATDAFTRGSSCHSCLKHALGVSWPRRRIFQQPIEKRDRFRKTFVKLNLGRPI